MLPLLAIALAALFAGAAPNALPFGSAPHSRIVGDDSALIREARLAQNRAIVAGDIGRTASYWTDDVTIRRALGQDVRGHAAYRKLFEDDGKSDSSLVYQREPGTITTSARFPLAFETGQWVGHLGSVRGPVVIGGPYSAQWVKRDGHWLIRAEVFVAMNCSGVGCGYKAVP